MAMTSGGGGNGRAPLSEINVTPLVDVMLVLLIIFMVAAPMMTAGIQVELPRADAPQMEIDEQKLMISIDRDRRIFIGEDEVPYARFAEAVRTNARIRDDGEVFIQADAAVPYGFVAEVLAMLQRAGVENFGLVTDPLGTAGNGTPSGSASARAASANLAPAVLAPTP